MEGKKIAKLEKLGMSLNLVLSELEGTRNYKDGDGNRLILHTDGTYSIEEKR